MVKIRIFVPHLELQATFEQVLSELTWSSGIEVDAVYVFGTPNELANNDDADILVARGMTYDALSALFPQKHLIQIKLSSFDILDALAKARESHPKKIALCLHNISLHGLENLERFCDAKIDMYDIPNEEMTEAAVEQARENGAEVFVGAGTLCGICDRRNLPRVHIHTKKDGVRAAIAAALETAKTLQQERSKAVIIRTMLNRSGDGIIAVDANNCIQHVNNQAHRIFQLSTVESVIGKPVQSLLESAVWRHIFDNSDAKEQVIQIGGKNYYIEYSPQKTDGQEPPLLVFLRSADQIMETGSRIRRELSEKGLVAKYSFDNIMGHSPLIQENIRMAKRYSQVNSNVLLIGETGTGKELFAHSIHRASARSNEPFVALNCAALPENLLESELFGYEAGAFSGASRAGKIGLFELAHKGTIFLDEIGEIPITLQAKLLRVLQEKEIRRIGSTSVHPIDVRVISATNINIEEKIQEGKFRSDLYYRLNLLDINIAPLRKRREDIQELMDFYLSHFACEMQKNIPILTNEAAQLLKNYAWPGNVRELRNICERLIVLSDTDVITEEMLLALKIPKMEPPKPPLTDDREFPGTSGPHKKKKEIAKELGVSRTTLWRMAKRQKEQETREAEHRN